MNCDTRIFREPILDQMEFISPIKVVTRILSLDLDGLDLL